MRTLFEANITTAVFVGSITSSGFGFSGIAAVWPSRHVLYSDMDSCYEKATLVVEHCGEEIHDQNRIFSSQDSFL